MRSLVILFLGVFLFSCGEEVQTKSPESDFEVIEIDSVSIESQNQEIDSILHLDSLAIADKIECNCRSSKIDKSIQLSIGRKSNFKTDSILLKWSHPDSILRLKSVSLVRIDSIPEELYKFKNIEFVEIRGLKGDYTGLKFFKKLKGLEVQVAYKIKLELNESSIESIKMGKGHIVNDIGLGKFSRLRNLDLGYSTIGGNELDINKLKCLKSVRITTYVGPEFDFGNIDLDSLPCLESLYLQNWENATGLPQNLENSNLKNLRYYGEGLSKEDKQRLKEFNASRK